MSEPHEHSSERASEPHEHSSERASEAARLAAVSAYVGVQTQAREDLVALCELAALICEVPNAAVNLIDDRLQHEVAATEEDGAPPSGVAAIGVDPSICDKDDSMCAVTLAAEGDLVIGDASEDPRFASNPWVDGRLGRVRFYAASVLRSPAGHAVGTLCVFDDVPGTLAEHRRVALAKLGRQVVDVLELQVRTTRLSETVAELARSHEQLAAFAGQISHDLKTPLTSMIGFTELLGELPAIATDRTAQGYLARTSSSSRRMLTMIDELLAYARIGGTLHRRSVALDDVLPQVLEDLGPAASGAGVRWSGPAVTADPSQLRALLQNLVGNAVTYRHPDGPCEVVVTTVAVPDAVQLQVADNGPGIATDQRAAALTPLTRLRHDRPGSGLGLATCARIVAAHGGRLQLADTAGGGTTVTVLLPTAAPPTP